VVRAARLCERLPAAAWRGAVDRRDGQYRYHEFAHLPVRSPRYESGTRPLWLVVSRGPDDGGGACRYFLSNAGPETPPDALAAATAGAAASSCFFRDAIGLLGMARYETRSWAGWHHHMSLVALAHWLVTRASDVLPAQDPGPAPREPADAPSH
jgi:SRSO17 transposase